MSLSIHQLDAFADDDLELQGVTLGCTSDLNQCRPPLGCGALI